jgi:hypothetical protein
VQVHRQRNRTPIYDPYCYLAYIAEHCRNEVESGRYSCITFMRVSSYKYCSITTRNMRDDTTPPQTHDTLQKPRPLSVQKRVTEPQVQDLSPCFQDLSTEAGRPCLNPTKIPSSTPSTTTPVPYHHPHQGHCLKHTHPTSRPLNTSKDKHLDPGPQSWPPKHNQHTCLGPKTHEA